MKSTRVFLSHSSIDHAYAMTIKRVLEANNIETWIFEEDLPFSTSIADRVREEIAQCDHLLVLLSEAACKSSWVAWELGYALQLQTLRDECYPTIIGVLRDNTRAEYAIQPLAYGQNEPVGSVYMFSDVRNHTVSNAYEVDQLVVQLKPQVTFITRTDGHEGELLQESFKCYEKLFPDPAQRCAPADIETWIDEARIRGSAIRCREVYAVLHLSDLVVGMAYSTSYPDRHWAFGSYFGVRRLWRSNNGSTAEWFSSEIERKLVQIDPDIRGSVFDVEPVDLTLLAEAAQRGRIGGYPDTARVLANIRQLRRLNLYQRHGALAVLAADGRALSYWNPAMDDDLQAENEREMILMVRLLQSTPPETVRLNELLDFLFDDLHGDAYEGPSTVYIPGYRRYLASIRQRVEQAAAGGWRLGKLSFQSAIRTLLNIAKREDLVRELDL